MQVGVQNYCYTCRQFNTSTSKVLATGNFPACKIVLALLVLGIRDCKTVRLNISLLQACNFPSFGKKLKLRQPYEQKGNGQNQEI